ncbi:MAG: DUF202 domain-containing protein [Thermodesulfovibrionales bacterium]|jgi:uncharacterized membrane protein YidH (DUF202 family)
MLHRKFDRLVKRGFLTLEALTEVGRESEDSRKHPEELLLIRGIPKQELLFCLSEYYGYPFTEYDENVAASYFITKNLDMERQKQGLWLPLSVKDNRAVVIAYSPDDPSRVEDIRKTLGVEEIDFTVALPSDLIRIIENSFDVNPHFPPSSGRTALAKVRTFLAERRSLLACYRTSLAKSRTGLAFIRTGLSFMTIALVLLRIFGIGYLTVVEALLFAAGAVMAVDGLIWYIPARRAGGKKLNCSSTEPTGGTTVLEVSNPGDSPVFTRTKPVEAADGLRAGWQDLSPVMRRRFLASDRTDLAEERTTLACFRTIMARARTGLAFARTGIAFIGLGIALVRQFPEGSWTVLDASLIAVGVLMVMEGFHWYLPGRRAGKEGFASVMKMGDKATLWDFVFPPAHKKPSYEEICSALLLRRACSPGIWATTGLALERTLLAERRNVMARLRTVMARSRTGMAFIRTGMSISAVGIGLLVYFGTGNAAWTIIDSVLAFAGFALIADGLHWHIPAERIRSQFPYCFGDMEIVVPDYGRPTCEWGKVLFSHDED